MTTETTTCVVFHLPQRPYSPIDAHNRAAAAKGSPSYAQATHYADYNGHHVTLSWNEYRQYYVAEYYWGGRVVIGRGDFDSCLKAVLDDYARGALGSSAAIYVRATDEAALAAARAAPGVVEGSLWRNAGNDALREVGREWWTWRHQVGVESARDMANPGCPVLIFDWSLCEAAADREAYESALKAKYGQVYR